MRKKDLMCVQRRLVNATLLFALGLAIGASGCAVLTERQVSAVSQFADATKGFGTSPGTVMRAHADLRVERGMLQAATAPAAQRARSLDNALNQESNLQELAVAADAAVEVLDDYAAMLGVLTSSQFTDELQNETIALGNSIDGGIAALNKATGSSISSVGDVVAAIIRGAGGIWIRREQQKALVAAVTSADPAIVGATQAIEKLMSKYLDPPAAGGLDLFDAEAGNVREILGRPSSLWSFDMIEQAKVALIEAQQGKVLATSCKTAAAKYRGAHKELVRAVTDRKLTVDGLVSQIRALADEVKAGKRVRDEIKDARKS